MSEREEIEQIATEALRDRAAWERNISDALGLTYEDHGTQHADMERCVGEIQRLKAERQAGWASAYMRGRDDERNGRLLPPSLAGGSIESMYDVARRITDEVCGEGTYAHLNRDNGNPDVQAAIKRAEEAKDEDVRKCSQPPPPPH